MKQQTRESLDKALFLDSLSRLGLVYFDRDKVRWEDRGQHKTLYIMFDLPRNSLYRLVEFCKLNSILITFEEGKIQMRFRGFQKHYDEMY
jgi:hypothetical protein